MRVGLVSLSAGMGITHMNEKNSGIQTANKRQGRGADLAGFEPALSAVQAVRCIHLTNGSP